MTSPDHRRPRRRRRRGRPGSGARRPGLRLHPGPRGDRRQPGRGLRRVARRRRGGHGPGPPSSTASRGTSRRPSPLPSWPTWWRTWLGKVAGREALWGVEPGWATPVSSFLEAEARPLGAGRGPPPPRDRATWARTSSLCARLSTVRRGQVRPDAEHVHRTNADIPEEIIRVSPARWLRAVRARGVRRLRDGRRERLHGHGRRHRGAQLGLARHRRLADHAARDPTRALVDGGTEEQKKEWLPKLASAESMAAVVVTEPDYGSDVAGIVTSATRPRAAGSSTASRRGARSPPGRRAHAAGADGPGSVAGASRDLHVVVEKPRGDGHGFVFTQGADDVADRPSGPGGGAAGGAPHRHDRLPRHALLRARVRELVRAGGHLVGGEEGLGKGFFLQMQGFENGRLQTAARALGVMQAAYEAAVRTRQSARCSARRSSSTS